MVELVQRVDVNAAPERVWLALTDWPRQGEWMLATDVRTVDGPADGVGGRLVARTGLPLPGRRVGLVDPMVITAWDPPRSVAVRHTGRLVRGTATFEVRPRGSRATVVWTERLDLPWGPLGRLGWLAVRPAAAAGLHRSLRRFADFVRRYPR